MSDLSNKIVLITGGASGIGKIMTRLTLERGGHVVIWDINQAGIDAVRTEFAARGKITGLRVDLADAAQIQAAGERVRREVGAVDVVINNAGIVVGKDFHEHDVAEITQTLSVNTVAPMLVTREFIGGMLARGSGHICNIASAGALLANPKMSVYVASKWGLVGWSDSLRVELRARRREGVRVTTILPYYIDTGMFDGVQSRLPLLQPEPTALGIIRAIERNKKLVTFPGYMYRLARVGQALLPVDAFDWFAGRVLGIYRTMDAFRGRG